MEPESSTQLSSTEATPDIHDRIRRRAEEIYFRNGKVPGRDLENWNQAEQEVRAEIAQAPRRTAIVIRVNGVQYVGEYQKEASDGYEPGEFEPGVPVPVRMDGDRMLVRRPNGKVLETTIVKRIG